MSDAFSTTIDLLRHGEAEGGKCYRGRQDDPLSATGWQQMHQAVGEHCPWDAIVTSPLTRCREFAHALAERHHIAIEQVDDLQEISFGDWEGKRSEDLLIEDAERLQLFWKNPQQHPPPGGESIANFEQRIAAAWQRLQQTYPNHHLLVVSHGGTMRMILRSVLNMPMEHVFRLDVGYACLSRIRIDGNRENPLPRLIFHAGRLP